MNADGQADENQAILPFGPSEAVISAIQDTYCLAKNYQRALDEYTLFSFTDVKGDIIYVNEQFCQLTGYSKEELLGQNHRILNSKFHDLSFFEDLWRTISLGNAWSGIIRNQAKDGSLFWVKTIIVPFKNYKNSIISYASLRTDVTEQMSLKDDLIQTRQRLEQEKEALEAKKIALNEILSYLEFEKKKVLNTITTNFETRIFPLLDCLLEQPTPFKKHLEIIKKTLHEIADPLIDKAQDLNEVLTPKELQICSLIRQSLVIKEIAALMRLSPRTVDKHRENIRKKLNITERKVNLGTYLSSRLSRDDNCSKDLN